MCSVTRCQALPLAIYNNCGLHGGLCAEHEATFGALLDSRSDGPNIPGQARRARLSNPYANRQLHADHLKLLVLMYEEGTVLDALARLEDAVVTFRDNADDPFIAADMFRGEFEGRAPYIRVSRVLEYFERFCWFPEQHVLFLKSLSAADFYGYLGAGLLPSKDPGAGAAHGDFSHRLQWHAVMRVVTDDFSTPIRLNWNHSPFELFVSLGQDQAKANNVWGVLFDAANTNCFRDPSHLRETVEKNRGGHMGFLATNLRRRHEKRAKMENVIRDHMRKNGIDTGALPPFGAAESAGAFIYQWLKSGPPHKLLLKSYQKNLPFLIGEMVTPPLDALAVQAFGAAVAADLWLSKTGKDYRRKGQHSHYEVIPTIQDGESGPVGAPRGDTVRGYSAAQVNNAVLQSRAAFNADFIVRDGAPFRAR